MEQRRAKWSIAVFPRCKKTQLAHRDIWRPRNNLVAFGAKRISVGIGAGWLGSNDPGLAEDVYNIFASVAVSRRLHNCQMLLVGRVREGLCQGSSNILSLYRRPRVPTFPSTGDVYSR